MKAIFGLNLSIEQREVKQDISINNVKDMDNKLFKEIYTILDTVNKKVQKAVDRYYGFSAETPEEPEERPEETIQNDQ